jgi:hypothetical protein
MSLRNGDGARRRWGRDSALGALAVFLGSALCLTVPLENGSGLAWARGNVAPSKPVKAARPVTEAQEAAADRLVTEGVLALARRDLPTARRVLSEAYRQAPRAETMYQLGLLAVAEGRTIAAHDRLRRYVADPAAQTEVSAARRKEAQRITAQPRPASAEVRVTGPAGALLFVDDEPVGMLPLSLPLLVSPGSHKLVVGQAGTPSPPLALTVAAHQVVVAQLDAGSAWKEQRLRPIFFFAEPGSGWENYRPLAEAALSGSAADVALLDAGSDAALDPACATDTGCILQAAERLGTEFVLRIRRQTSATPPKKIVERIELWDVAAQAPAAEAECDCETKDEPARNTARIDAVRSAIEKGAQRGRGTLAVLSAPKGALLLVDGRATSVTPVERPCVTGPHTIELALSGYERAQRSIRIEKDQRADLSFELTREKPPAPPPLPPLPPPTRPRWRLAVGAVAMGVGAGLIGLGASGLAVNDQCAGPPSMAPGICPQLYDTAKAGAALVGVGGATLIIGVVVLALPPKKSERAVRLAER